MTRICLRQIISCSSDNTFLYTRGSIVFLRVRTVLIAARVIVVAIISVMHVVACTCTFVTFATVFTAVCLSVCLSVCPLRLLLEALWVDFCEMWEGGRRWTKKCCLYFVSDPRHNVDIINYTSIYYSQSQVPPP